ncbi:hypothetical protein HU200_057693 [Digitaria exilis]|uniref:DUF1618 domain-containing protein n=1 Tax=Digitaria exilis TaxID=1010633 RepID=A0A835ANJ4_9POAL|nr:hypothetical protein HU200_057693 [Digitaria exilis]CAB3485876.1 unnamed protein product [Digitaria exilis]
MSQGSVQGAVFGGGDDEQFLDWPKRLTITHDVSHAHIPPHLVPATRRSPSKLDDFVLARFKTPDAVAASGTVWDDFMSQKLGDAGDHLSTTTSVARGKEWWWKQDGSGRALSLGALSQRPLSTVGRHISPARQAFGRRWQGGGKHYGSSSWSSSSTRAIKGEGISWSLVLLLRLAPAGTAASSRLLLLSALGIQRPGAGTAEAAPGLGHGGGGYRDHEVGCKEGGFGHHCFEGAPRRRPRLLDEEVVLQEEEGGGRRGEEGHSGRRVEASSERRGMIWGRISDVDASEHLSTRRMDRSEAMLPSAAARPEGKGYGNARCTVLLDRRGHDAAFKDASTASSRTTAGHPIEVTFCTRPPPAVSNFSIHCPDLQLPPGDLYLAPKAIAAADDLVLLRVPVNPLGKDFYQHNDYFDPKLDLLPNPWPDRFGDDEIGILSCGAAAADGGKQYVVAALKMRPISEFTFTLHLYRSKPGGEAGSWTSQLVSVEEPLRDRVCPIPDSAERLMYHLTTKVITIGGANGTVAWVDLWRGMLLCDVLEKSPKLLDLPLPWPAKGNWGIYLSDSETFCRDIVVSQNKDSIKYVEMEIIPPRMITLSSRSPDTDSYLEWVRPKKCLPQPPCSFVPGQWKVTTWSMPIPVTSWDNWRLECTAELGEFRVDDPMDYEFLHKFKSSHGDKEAKDAALSLGSLYMAHPAFSIDDDVVYLLADASSRSKMGAVLAFDVGKKELRGIVQRKGRSEQE